MFGSHRALRVNLDCSFILEQRLGNAVRELEVVRRGTHFLGARNIDILHETSARGAIHRAAQVSLFAGDFLK
jgi:hypothetical protein